MKTLTLITLMLTSLVSNAFQMSLGAEPSKEIKVSNETVTVPTPIIKPWNGTYKGDLV